MKKGFTLIELLAVILILGIIALIAIPTINNILKDARRGAFSSTLTNIEKAVENECTLNQIKNKDINYTYTITDGIISPSVELKGDLPDGTVYVDDECKVSYTLYNGNFSAVKNNEETLIEDKKIYTESILNGAVPVLSNNLIPVTIDNDGTVRKADIYSKWYSYEEKLWANAVILTEAGKVEENGIILEDSIESYFVWIPRYKYKLFNMGNYDNYIEGIPTNTDNSIKSIEIIFENKNTPVSVGVEIGQYHSHPSFQAFNVNGFWASKFETSGSKNNLKVKPNIQSFRNINIKNIFELTYNYKRNNDSHMMKNTEWGAITYLSLSKYGINERININNNSSLKTGYGAAAGTNQSIHPGIFGTSSDITLPYNTESGYKSSTSGNITGIYDMRGGASEYMASYMEGYLGGSEFTTNPIQIYGPKYFDIYPNDSDTSKVNNRILGDATGELGPFYYYSSFIHNNWWSEHSYFISTNSPWFLRGGVYDNGSLAGILNFNRGTGESHSLISFRVVLNN